MTGHAVDRHACMQRAGRQGAGGSWEARPGRWPINVSEGYKVRYVMCVSWCGSVRIRLEQPRSGIGASGRLSLTLSPHAPNLGVFYYAIRVMTNEYIDYRD